MGVSKKKSHIFSTPKPLQLDTQLSKAIAPGIDSSDARNRTSEMTFHLLGMDFYSVFDGFLYIIE